MSRKKSREVVFKMLFPLGFAQRVNEEVSELLSLCTDDEQVDGVELSYITNLYNQVTGHIEVIDKLISELAVGFTFERIYKTDLAVLRMSIAEIKYTDTEISVCINEAVDIAKKYGAEKSGGFVNGILAKVKRGE